MPLYGVSLGRLTRPVLPLVYKSALARRIVLRDVACHGDRISAARALELIDDGIECEILADLCASDWQIPRLDPLPCQITIGWGEKETLLPAAAHGKIEQIPQAWIKTLPDVGHVPMVDHPELVASTILAATGAARQQR